MQKIFASSVNEKASLVPLPEAHEHAFVYSEYKEPRFHFYWHYHQEIELVFIRRGGGLRYIGRSVEPCRAGELILLGSNLPHAWGSSAKQKRDAVWTVVQFLPERWGNLFWEMPEAKKLLSLFKEAERGLQFTGKHVAQAGRTLDRIGKMEPYSFPRLVGMMELFDQLLSMECRALNASPVPLSGFRNDDRLQAVLALINTGCNEKLTQAEAAQSVDMAPAVFSRWFKQYMGRTFQRYLNEVRIAHVCFRLSDGAENITSVAMSSGYRNLSNFNRRFLEITGITPKDFRAKAFDLKEEAPKRMVVKYGLNGWLDISRPNGRQTAPQVA